MTSLSYLIVTLYSVLIVTVDNQMINGRSRKYKTIAYLK